MKQQQFHREQAIDKGVDENGEFEIIPLSMVRGGELQPHTVHTKPLRHIINDSAPTPRGWYKDKHEPKNKRPRPCYTEALLTTPYGGYCPVGCKFSLLAGTLVSTQDGCKPIQEFKIGDAVIGRNWNGLTIAKVLAPMKHAAHGYYRVQLSNGNTLNATADHPVFTINNGWKALGDCHAKERLESLRPLWGNIQLLDQGSEIVLRMSSTAHIGDSEAYQYCETCEEISTTLPTLPILWGTYTKAVAQYMQQMLAESQDEGQICCQNTHAWEALEIIGPGQTASQRCNENTYSQWGESYTLGYVQAIQDRDQWARNEIPIQMGNQDSAMVNGSGLGMGVREQDLHNRRYGGSVHSGLPLVQEWSVGESCGSEGLQRPRCDGEIGEICGGYAFHRHNTRNMGCRCSYIVGDFVTVLSMEWIDEDTTVYDIQTTTENFYAEGVLVHNCYVDHGTRGYRATGLPTVNPNYPDSMRRQVRQLMVSGAAYISSFTEPFHRLENTYHVTERLSQVFIDEGLPIFYLSRESPPDWAIDNLLANPYSYMQWSMNTSNPDVFRRLSPGAMKIDNWLLDVKKLSKLGIYISIQCNPVLPGIVTLDDLVNLITIGAEAGVNHFIFKFAEQVYNNRKLLMDRLAGIPGVDEFDNLMTQTIGGVYTIRQDVRIEWLEVLLQATRSNDVTMSTCYEYFDDSAAGSNLAPYVTTSRGGCHGQIVPVHYRTEPNTKFKPLQGCFESGCLYCAEHGTKICNNDRLLSAPMLNYKDMRSIILQGNDNNWELVGSAPSPKKLSHYNYWYPEQQTFAEFYNWE